MSSAIVRERRNWRMLMLMMMMMMMMMMAIEISGTMARAIRRMSILHGPEKIEGSVCGRGSHADSRCSHSYYE